ncbi:hypothetical protein SOW02_10370 [Pectobacterium actinidiae]|uniref:hypothetical protein n=1 Tax=Pectobacterium actinidiae TaxID=1507808 RepID=UPI002A7FD632|nr:hypothetical protein [Pectobacterium actinidiae]MDY4315340.1 hypothetical protein [Pectobacterium actinidiae]
MTQENHDLSAQSNTRDRAVAKEQGAMAGAKHFTTDGYLFLEMLSATSDAVIIRFDCIAAVVDAGKAGSEVHLLSGDKILVKHYAIHLMEYIKQAFEDVRNKLPESKGILPQVIISTISKKNKAELSGLKYPI